MWKSTKDGETMGKENLKSVWEGRRYENVGEVKHAALLWAFWVLAVPASIISASDVAPA